MPLVIFACAALVILVIYGVYRSIQAKKQQEELNKRREEEKKQRAKAVERRKQYVSSIGPNARIIVNNGIHLFFKDDVQKIFGNDETGTTYSFEGLQSIQVNADSIIIHHVDCKSITGILVGRDCITYSPSVPLDAKSVNAIYTEMMPVLRANLHEKLDIYGVKSTHEYEHEGSIFGCDINSEQFYMAYGCPAVYDFTDLLKVKFEDLSNDARCTANYIIYIYVRHHYDSSLDQYPECTIYFDTKDSTYYGILAMLKGIRNRQKLI